ncbi:MAG: HAMP domain-containing protein [Spirochaetes bacterium]|nr:HAMP domain-containing protein [Spirochaetota bacterium]
MDNDADTFAGFKELFSDLKIRTKLISIISLILIVSLAGMILLATYFFKSDNEIRANELNHKIADITSQKMQNDCAALVEKLNLMGNTMIQQIPQKALFTDLFFANDRNMIYVGIGTRAGGGIRFERSVNSRAFFDENRLTLQAVDAISETYAPAFLGAFGGEAVIQNVSKSFNTPALAMALPFQKNADGSVASILVCYLKLDRFLQAFRTRDIFETFMVSARGDVIAHPDSRIVLSHGNFIRLPIVEEMLKSRLDNGQKRYRDDDGEYRLGSFKKIGFGGLGVIATVSEEKAFRAVYQIQRRNILIMIIVLNLGILIVYFFSKTLTTPITRLVGATKEIEKGNFRVDIVPTSGDEIGELTRSFVSMGRGLEERETLKETFGKFVSKDIAELVLSGKVKLGGERKTATVFFSDIREFTSISEKLEPEEVVEFLNQYMTRMVNCVEVTNGVVDKFIGDAIMAVWGAPVSYGNDVENAINGALMMRNELMGFNKGRGGPKKPVIRIGCGINTGPVLAGQIGSEERMEYTVIGDTVNLASRIEQLNKPFGTDILISQETCAQIRHKFLVEPMQKIRVKGKAEPQQIYAVLGRRDDPEAPKNIDGLRRLLGIDMKGKPESPPADEVKYEILK